MTRIIIQKKTHIVETSKLVDTTVNKNDSFLSGEVLNKKSEKKSETSKNVNNADSFTSTHMTKNRSYNLENSNIVQGENIFQSASDKVSIESDDYSLNQTSSEGSTILTLDTGINDDYNLATVRTFFSNIQEEITRSVSNIQCTVGGIGSKSIN
mmetsp:Transcript_25541/g.58927  ORF Transcript_25541/g.58927 Transcript_25541/m.58927 type:complete len:154 (-) Transcript_25541:133-594(-)